MKAITQTLILLLFGLAPLVQQAQTTGNFDETITFMGESRTLSFSVPNNYDPNTSYQLVVGMHGLGDNSNNYRNAVINSLNWGGLFPNTIFVFPDGGSDPGKDFYEPAGDEDVIQECIDFASQNYNIDNTQIILQGFSLGGRSALKYGLDHPGDFKGLLLNTPAIQGKLDAINIPAAGVEYNYANADQVVIYSNIGNDDLLYVPAVNRVINTLKRNNATIKHHNIANMGHTLPASSFITEAVAFFDNSTPNAYDLDLFDIDMKQRSCETAVDPACVIQNNGSENVTSVEINYSLGGVSGSTTWMGNLGAYEHASVSIPTITVPNGIQDLTVTVGMINGNNADQGADNNSFTQSIEIAEQAAALPILQDFESENPSWLIGEDASINEWYLDDEVSQSGNNSFANFGTIYLFVTEGMEESFLSPVVDLTTAEAPILTFDLAYNYHQFTPPFTLIDTTFADTLEILISTDCGETYTSIYKMGGTDLATAEFPITNPNSLQAGFFDPSSEEWRNEKIDLSDYANETNVVVKFNYISNMGGSIYIDNIEMRSLYPQSAAEDEMALQTQVFPNPASDWVTIQTEAANIESLRVYNTMGQLVLSEQYNAGSANNQVLDVSGLPNGTYYLEMISEQERNTQSLIIQH